MPTDPKKIWEICALSPLLLFFFIFMGSGVYFTLQEQEYAFYQVSATVAILPAIILSICLARIPLQKALNIFLEGVRDSNIITMCLIYLLAGAFASVLQGTEGITSTVNLILHIIPNNANLPALFLISALISMAMGTSMGTIAAVGPIGVGIATSINLPLPLAMGAIVGGAMFGDNLSLISDTSIAATQIHGCSLKEKFQSNLVIALPAMIMTIAILSFIAIGSVSDATLSKGEYQLVHCLPYLIVLGLAAIGTNVYIVLIIGIGLAGLIGTMTIPHYQLINLSKNIFDGYKSMFEILVLSLLMGGLAELIKQQGGFNILIRRLESLLSSKKDKSSKSAEGVISVIASFSDICTANNTAAIILSGEATKEIAFQHQIPAARAATLVDLFSCVFQGILPYSAQLLMAGSLSGLSPMSIIPNVHYCFFLGLAGVCAIAFQLPRFSFIKSSALNTDSTLG